MRFRVCFEEISPAPVAIPVFDSTVVSITACHAVDPGSIPGRRAFFFAGFLLFFFFFFLQVSVASRNQIKSLFQQTKRKKKERERNVSILVFLCFHLLLLPRSTVHVTGRRRRGARRSFSHRQSERATKIFKAKSTLVAFAYREGACLVCTANTVLAEVLGI